LEPFLFLPKLPGVNPDGRRKITSRCEGEKDFCKDLLAYIEEGRVIRVVGPELLNLAVLGKTILLYQSIAEQLLKENGLSAMVVEKPSSSREIQDFPTMPSSAKTQKLTQVARIFNSSLP
jgi:hypothetical protein